MSSGITRNNLGPAARAYYDRQKAAQQTPAQRLLSATISARVKKGTRDSARDAQEFLNICDKAGVPRPELEFRFNPHRMFRADFCWVRERLILEVNGGVFIPGGGGHNSVGGFIKDQEKLNSAATMGFRVLQFLPRELLRVETIEMVRRALRGAKKW